MGKSIGNAIYLSDSIEEVRRKVSMAVTDPARIKATDKGHPDICNVYKYHCAFNKVEAMDIEEHCQQGRIGCVACKENVAEKVNPFLEPRAEVTYSKTESPSLKFDLVGSSTIFPNGSTTSPRMAASCFT